MRLCKNTGKQKTTRTNKIVLLCQDVVMASGNLKSRCCNTINVENLHTRSTVQTLETDWQAWLVGKSIGRFGSRSIENSGSRPPCSMKARQ